MNVKINHKDYKFDHQLSLYQVLEKIDKNNKKGIAVSVNNAIIQRGKWQEHMINDSDNITIITATQGG